MPANILLHPSPLGTSHPANHGVAPIYVYDPNPHGGLRPGQQDLAQKAFGAGVAHEKGPSGHAYAIPTRLRSGARISQSDVKAMVCEFCDYAREQAKVRFQVTRIGGYRSRDDLCEHEI